MPIEPNILPTTPSTPASPSGTVFNIQRFSIHDGPGIRTTVFVSGCPLHCFWCHNPEGLKMKPQVQFFPQKCILCGACVQACEHSAHTLDEHGHLYDRSRCVRCGECIEECCAEAVQMTAKGMTAQAVVEEVLRDRPFYETSGGGVTLSGGEPALQAEFSLAILAACKAQGLHTAVETSGHCAWETLEAFLPVVDLVMMDLKHLDAEKHRAATGVSNQVILDNARRLAASGVRLLFRVPVIPTINDTGEEIGAISRFVSELPTANAALELLPFHRLAGDKYASLGLEYRARDLQTPTKEHMANLLATARQYFPQTISR